MESADMTTHFQLAAEKDTALMVEMMREFYQHESLAWTEEVARGGLHKLFRDPGLGSAYIILMDEHPAGYFVLTYPFSLEFHGKFGLLDEIYIREAFRRKNLGRAVLEFAENICRKSGIQALRMEVAEENRAARTLYRSAGFRQDLRHLFTKWL
jgi:ribosomal protein S18 acetylase RimI-like enzyme